MWFDSSCCAYLPKLHIPAFFFFEAWAVAHRGCAVANAPSFHYSHFRIHGQPDRSHRCSHYRALNVWTEAASPQKSAAVATEFLLALKASISVVMRIALLVKDTRTQWNKDVGARKSDSFSVPQLPQPVFFSFGQIKMFHNKK